MKKIVLVGWDADYTLHPVFFTSMAAEKSNLNPRTFINEFEEKGWFDKEDTDRWIKEYNDNKPIKRVSDIARMLTDFLYRMKKEDKSIITKRQTIEGKQSLLRGLKMSEIIEMSDSVEYNPGVEDAVKIFKKAGIGQTLFSEGLGPHITYQKRKLGFDEGKGRTPMIKLPSGDIVEYEDKFLAESGAELTGEVNKTIKAEEFFEYLDSKKIKKRQVAVIDDSDTNVDSLFLPIIKDGGIAIGYDPMRTNKTFREKKIPVLKGNDMRNFAKIVLDPRKSTLKRYCDLYE